VCSTKSSGVHPWPTHLDGAVVGSKHGGQSVDAKDEALGLPRVRLGAQLTRLHKHTYDKASQARPCHTFVSSPSHWSALHNTVILRRTSNHMVHQVIRCALFTKSNTVSAGSE
jgi:hypothetical protein